MADSKEDNRNRWLKGYNLGTNANQNGSLQAMGRQTIYSSDAGHGQNYNGPGRTRVGRSYLNLLNRPVVYQG